MVRTHLKNPSGHLLGFFERLFVAPSVRDTLYILPPSRLDPFKNPGASVSEGFLR